MVERLQGLRESLGLSREMAGELIGVTQEEIAHWEAPGVRLDKAALQKLALLLSANEAGSPSGGASSTPVSRTEPLDTDRFGDVERRLEEFRQQLRTLSEKQLLPIDRDTIEYCVTTMRKQIEEDATGSGRAAP